MTQSILLFKTPIIHLNRCPDSNVSFCRYTTN